MKLANDRIVDLAVELRTWLQSTIEDIAGSTHTELLENTKHNIAWHEIVLAEKANGTVDLCGFFADWLYDDVAAIYELLGDRILDTVEGNYRNAIKIAGEISRTAHVPLKEAMLHLITSWRANVEVLVVCVHCGRVLRRVGEATVISHGDCISYFGVCNEGEDYHRHNAELLERDYDDYVKQFGPKK